MPVYKAVGEPSNLKSLGIDERSARVQRRYPTRYIPDAQFPAPAEELIVRFEADGPAEAEQFFRRLSAQGCLKDHDAVLNREASATPGAKTWHYRHLPHYISRQMRRLGISGEGPEGTRFFHDAQRCEAARPIEKKLGELCNIYHANPKPDGVARLDAAMATHVRAFLAQADAVHERLVVLAAATGAAVAEGRTAFGMPPERTYVIMTAAELDEKIEAARAEAPKATADADPQNRRPRQPK